MVHVFGKCHSTIFIASLMGLLAAAFAFSIGVAQKEHKITQDANLCWC